MAANWYCPDTLNPRKKFNSCSASLTSFYPTNRPRISNARQKNVGQTFDPISSVFDDYDLE